MPCPHNEISIVQRSQQQSAIAAAAYQSGEKLFCEYDQQVKHYPEKRGIVHNEILLPANAPQKYADRNTLAAIVTASIALLLMNFSKSGRTVDESRAWLKRIIITWAVLNSLGFLMAYITPFFVGGQWTAS